MKSKMRTRIRTSIFKQIQKYFKQDYNYRTIIQLVEKKFNVLLSLRSLERILQYHKMKRKNIQESQIEDIVVAILLELNGGGYNLGYKAMWKRIRRVYGVEVKQKTVLELLHLIDPEGIDLRSRYRLKRRVYQVPGPNFLWHADGHDKLKRYGFAIYGIIDGYSRKVLLLEVSRSNNNPRIIGHYYLKLVQKRGYLPTVIRTDHGTEVILMEDFQVALRLNHLDRNAGEHSFVKGKSVHNQRIEAWWRQLRQKMCDFYIHLFRGMEQAQILDVDDPLHIETLRFCFGHLIRNEIENTRKEWNEHRIRKQNNRDVVAGQPNELFHCPENHGSQDCRKDLDCDNLPYLMDRFTEEPRLYSAEMERLVEDIPGVSIPSDAESAFLLYNYLIDFFNTL